MADEETDHSDSSTAASPLQQNEDVGGQQFLPYQNPPVQTAPVPTQAQTAASLPSLPQTADFLSALSATRAPLQSSVGTACISPPAETAAALPSSSQTVDFLKTLSATPAPLQSSLQTETAVSLPSSPQTVDFLKNLSATRAPFQSPIQAAPISPKAQTAASIASSSKTIDFLKNFSTTGASAASSSNTVDFLKNFSTTGAPFQYPVSHSTKETPSISESAQAAISLGSLLTVSPVPPLPGTAASVSPFPLNATVAQPLSRGSRGSGLAQASNTSTLRPFQKRQATQPPPTCGRAVRGRFDPSLPGSIPPPVAYPTQTAPVPPQAQSVDFFPSPTHTARPDSRSATETPPRISQDLNRTLPRGGLDCPICRMDLALGQSISAMPCGHRFHTRCLNLSRTAAPLVPHVLLPPCPICGRRWR